MKFSLCKSPEKFSHVSQFTNNFPSLNLEVDNIIQIRNGGMPLDPIFFSPYQQITSGQHTNQSKRLTMIYQIFILPQNHTNPDTVKENYKAFSIAFRFYLVKDKTSHLLKAPNSNVKIIAYINIENGFDLIGAVVFYMITQLGLTRQ